MTKAAQKREIMTRAKTGYVLEGKLSDGKSYYLFDDGSKIRQAIYKKEYLKLKAIQEKGE